MEYNSWIEYLIKLTCAIYSIDPSEIGWDISRSGGNSGLFEASQADRLQHSKDKGLYPILKFIQRKINKYIIEPLNPEYEFVFMGLNGMTIDQELEMDIKKLGSFQTINEIRQKWDLPEIEEDEGDLIENSVYFQAYNQRKQQEMAQEQQQQMGGFGGEEGYSEEGNEEGEEEENPFDYFGGEEEENEEGNEEENEEENESEEEEKAEDNLFVKAFNEFLQKEENELNK